MNNPFTRHCEILVCLSVFIAINFVGTTGFSANRWWDGGSTSLSDKGDGVSSGGAGVWDVTTINGEARRGWTLLDQLVKARR